MIKHFWKHLQKSVFYLFIWQAAELCLSPHICIYLLKVNAIQYTSFITISFSLWYIKKKNTHNNCNVRKRKKAWLVLGRFLNICSMWCTRFPSSLTSKNVLSFYAEVAIGIISYRWRTERGTGDVNSLKSEEGRDGGVKERQCHFVDRPATPGSFQKEYGAIESRFHPMCRSQSRK